MRTLLTHRTNKRKTTVPKEKKNIPGFLTLLADSASGTLS
jgi:hypothetical protein